LEIDLLLGKSLKVSALVITTATILFTGCSSKTSNTYGSLGTKVYKPIPNEKIRNSKAMHRATMRPYQIAGKWYYPTLAKVGDVQRGIASWYGPNFHAKKTSNGEIYNMYADTAAHKTLPMNTMVRVDNLENGKSVIVRINDRGPFVTGRIIDLSNKAAHAIEMVKKGTAKVNVTVLGFHAKIAKTKLEKQETATVGKYYVQVGAFSKIEGAKITKRKFEAALDSRYKIVIKTTDLSRVFVSGFRSEAEAVDFKQNNGLNNAMIIAE
jgi:rare lipoprotein A